MKFTSIEIVTANPELGMALNFEDPYGVSPYQVLEVEDLDADELLTSYSSSGKVTGQRFYNYTLPVREPVIKVGLNPRPGTTDTVSSLRDDIYRMISASRDGTVYLYFLDGDDEVAMLSGSITGVEPALFERRPTVDIRLVCYDPMLRAPSPVEVAVPDTPITTLLFDDTFSTAPHGLYFTAEFQSDASNLKIYDSTNDWSFTVTPKSGFDRHDVIVLAGEGTVKELYRLRGSNKLSLADVVSQNSVWPIVFPLGNEFIFNRSLIFETVSHYPAYWGV